MKQIRSRFLAWLCMAVLLCGITTVSAAADGSADEPTGYVVVSVEAATTGYGYLLAPITVPVYEGENAAQVLDRVLTENGFSYKASGTLTASFYLSAIGQGGVLPSGAAEATGAGAECKPPKRLGAELPEIILENIKPTLEGYYEMEVETAEDLNDGWTQGENTIGEFDYCPLSGWMCSVNNVFPSDYLSATSLQDGDVVRVQYTMAWGMDLGAGWGDFFPTANKTELCKALADVNGADDAEEMLADETVAAAYEAAVAAGVTVDAAQETVDAAVASLKEAVAAYEAAKEAVSPTPTPTEAVAEPTEAPAEPNEETPETGDGQTTLILLAAVLCGLVAAGSAAAKKCAR